MSSHHEPIRVPPPGVEFLPTKPLLALVSGSGGTWRQTLMLWSLVEALAPPTQLCKAFPRSPRGWGAQPAKQVLAKPLPRQLVFVTTSPRKLPRARLSAADNFTGTTGRWGQLQPLGGRIRPYLTYLPLAKERTLQTLGPDNNETVLLKLNNNLLPKRVIGQNW